MRDMGKFRGKRLDNGEWVYGNLVSGKGMYGEECLIVESIDEVYETDAEIGAEFKRVDPAAVGEYTGLLDGETKIWEGDLFCMQDEYHTKYIGEVKMIGGQWVLEYGDGYISLHWHLMHSGAYTNCSIGKVIGTKHDAKGAGHE